MDAEIDQITDIISELFRRLRLLNPEDTGALDHILVSFQRVAQLLTFIPDTTRLSQSLWQTIRGLQERLQNSDVQVGEVQLSHPGTGRSPPSYKIDPHTLEYMVEELFLTVPEIAESFRVSTSTVKRRMTSFGLAIRATYTVISDDDLDYHVTQLVRAFPNAGVRNISGHLLSGHCRHRQTNEPTRFRVQRARIRNSLFRVDPIGLFNRLRNIRNIPRVSYNVFMPMQLWHQDGNHKLIRYRLVVHAGIDGFSRKIMFMGINDNNRADTVLRLFVGAVDKIGNPPLSVRSDHGGENMEVCRWMLHHPRRGPGRGSFITGKSVHNQRIERLWRDLFRQLICVYKYEFDSMASDGILNPLSDVDIWCLHQVYLPVIRGYIQRFVDGWNNHPMSTTGGRSPNQLFEIGLLSAPVDAQLAQERLRTEAELEHYGVDWNGPVPEDDGDDGDDDVTVPDTSCPLDREQLAEFNRFMSTVEGPPHADFLRAKACVNRLTR